jgi:hypothetical protein
MPSVAYSNNDVKWVASICIRKITEKMTDISDRGDGGQGHCHHIGLL